MKIKILDLQSLIKKSLTSTYLPTKTIQAKGSDLKRVFSDLMNKVEEVTNFNQ